MKKLSLIAVALLAGVSLNAAVVATVNGKNISDTEINEAFAPMLRGQNINSLPADQKKMLVQQYVAQVLILEDAKKQNLDKSPEFAKELNKAKDAIALNIYQKKIFDTVKVDKTRVKAIYDQNKDKFIEPARVQAKHILLPLQGGETQAKEIINELKNLKGDALDKRFSEIARTKSIDTASAQQGGELGWFGEDGMVKPFSDAAFSLKKGTITLNPIKTQYGYHIILKENSTPKKQLSFDQVRAGLENDLKMQETQRLIGQKAQELFGQAKVDIK